ncbi:MAG: DegV family protein [Romboutsia sp.]|nr:DegV family protein [Romboutsia sp.]
MKIKLICDSLCDVPKEIQDKEYLDVVPLTIIFNDKEYKDGVDISKEEYYEVLKNNKEIPKTSQATYVQFSEVFNKYVDEGYKIICINGSSKSSGTYQSAMLAKSDMDEKGNDIHIFDTMSLSLGSGQFVIKACDLIEDGSSADDIIKELESIRESVMLFFAPKTLDYLKKSGRASVATSIIGNILNIIPVFSFQNGEANLEEKVRGSKNLATKLVDIILERNNGDLSDKIVTIGYGDNFKDFEKLENEVQKRIKAKKVLITRGGACICSHTGPDILAISCSN